jgi:RNA polymerase sigma-70 factor (ECF subfamily)
MNGFAKVRESADVGIVTEGSSADPRSPAVDEGELLVRHRQGEREAFARLVAEYRAPVYSYLVRCGVAEADRDDLFQEIFVRVHRAADQYRAERPLHPWLFTIVANAARNHHRQSRVRELVFADDSGNDPQDAAPNGEQQLDANQTKAWLEEQILGLPRAQREVLTLVCIHNVPQKAAAEILGLRPNTLKTHLRRARLELMKRLRHRNRRVRDEALS